MTTRKPSRRPSLLSSRLRPLRPAAALLVAGLALLAGCATPGPARGYYLSGDNHAMIVQFDPLATDALATEQASFLRLFDYPLALAYDPFTDHFFIRLNPGDRFLVVDRPARRIKRGFTLDGVNLPVGGGDIAIRSRDRHLFIAHPTEPRLIETNLNGRFIRDIPLPGLAARPAGVAYDQARDRLLIRDQRHPGTIDIRTLDGHVESSVTLDHATTTHGLAFDSAAREFFIPPEPAGPGLRVFSIEGRLLRTLALPDTPAPAAFDIGPRSFLRLF